MTQAGEYFLSRLHAREVSGGPVDIEKLTISI
jgi:hypothetical protein